MVHRPQDLDTASSLALLQEEAMVDQAPRRYDFGFSSKKTHTDTSKQVMTPSSKIVDEKKNVDSHQHKTTDAKISDLKKYRRSKGLCFKCGEKWSPQHTCAANVSLHVLEELLQCIAQVDDYDTTHPTTDSDSNENLMKISIMAVDGTEDHKTTLHLRGHLADKEVFILVDSGFTASFINTQTAQGIIG